MRGAGRFHFNPALAGYAAGRNTLSGWRQTTACASNAGAARVRGFIPTSRPPRASLPQAEKDYRLTQLSCETFIVSRLSRSVLPYSPPAYADGETAARKRRHRL